MSRKVDFEKLAELVITEACDYGLEVLLLGAAAEVDAMTAELRKHAPQRNIWHYTPDEGVCLPMKLGKSCCVLLSNVEEFSRYPFPDCSIVVDPFGIVPFKDGIAVMDAEGC